MKIEAYSTSDRAGCNGSRKSRTGALFVIIESPVLWNSNRQSVAAVSSTEANYTALSATEEEVSWIRRFCCVINLKRQFTNSAVVLKTPIQSDNTATLAIIKQDRVSARARRIEFRYHYVREMLAQDQNSLHYKPTMNQPVKMLEKSLFAKEIKNWRDKLPVTMTKWFNSQTKPVCMLSVGDKTENKFLFSLLANFLNVLV